MQGGRLPPSSLRRGGPAGIPRSSSAPFNVNSEGVGLDNEEHIADALRWIVGVFLSCGADFQVVGGLAARAFGATRPIVDLDFYVRESDLPRVLAAVEEFRVWGPEHYQDDSWDLTFAKLERDGVKIELAKAEGARYFDRLQGRWVGQDVNFSRSESRELFGLELPIIPQDQLMSCKRALDRDVDRLDLEAIG